MPVVFGFLHTAPLSPAALQAADIWRTHAVGTAQLGFKDCIDVVDQDISNAFANALRMVQTTMGEAKIMKSLKMTRRPSERLAALCAEHGEAYKRVLLDEVGAPVRAFLEAQKLVEHDGTHWTVTLAPPPVVTVDAENAEAPMFSNSFDFVCYSCIAFKQLLLSFITVCFFGGGLTSG